VRLTATDPATSTPLVGASVNFGGRDVGTTDAAGTCQWTGMFPAGGTKGLLGRSGNWLVYGELTIVGADGRSRTVRLDEVMTDTRRPLRDDGPLQLNVPVAASASHNPPLQRTATAPAAP
jgi:hypothetical protein